MHFVFLYQRRYAYTGGLYCSFFDGNAAKSDVKLWSTHHNNYVKPLNTTVNSSHDNGLWRVDHVTVCVTGGHLLLSQTALDRSRLVIRHSSTSEWFASCLTTTLLWPKRATELDGMPCPFAYDTIRYIMCAQKLTK